MNLRLSILLSVLIATLSGCAGITHNLNPVNWFSSDIPAEIPAPLINFTPTVVITTRWHTTIGPNNAVAFAPALAIDSIYVASAKGLLARLNPISGKPEWQINAKMPFSAGVGASIDNEYIGTPRADLIAYDESGKIRWTSRLSSEIVGVPKMSGGTVVVRTEDGFIYGLDADTGKQKWVYQHTLPTLMLRNQASVLITKGAIFAGYAGGKLVALSLDTGNVGWEAEVAIPRGASEIERVSDVTSMPVIDDNQVCAVAYQGRVACFDIHSGNLIWAKQISSTAGLVMDDNNIYVSDDDGDIVAFDKTTGTSVWKQTQLHARHLTAPCRIGDYLAVGDIQGYVHLLALNDGHFVGRTATDGTAIISPPQEHNNSLIVQTAKGNVYALSLP